MKEYIYAEINDGGLDPDYKEMEVSIHCSENTLVNIISAMLIKIAKEHNNLNEMLAEIIYLTSDPTIVKAVKESKSQEAVGQMIEKALREARDGRTD